MSASLFDLNGASVGGCNVTDVDEVAHKSCGCFLRRSFLDCAPEARDRFVQGRDVFDFMDGGLWIQNDELIVRTSVFGWKPTP